MNDLAPFDSVTGPSLRTIPRDVSLRSLLRAHTAEQHAVLDAHFSGFAEGPTLDLYHRFVRMNHAAYRALRNAMAQASLGDSAELDRDVSAGLGRLEADMTAMELESARPPRFALERYEAPELAGIAYVLDGSKAGARFIHRKLSRAGILGSGVGRSALFLEAAFAGETKDDREAMLSALDAGEATSTRAAHAAEATFAVFEDALCAVDGRKDRVRGRR